MNQQQWNQGYNRGAPQQPQQQQQGNAYPPVYPQQQYPPAYQQPGQYAQNAPQFAQSGYAGGGQGYGQQYSAQQGASSQYNAPAYVQNQYARGVYPGAPQQQSQQQAPRNAFPTYPYGTPQTAATSASQYGYSQQVYPNPYGGATSSGSSASSRDSGYKSSSVDKSKGSSKNFSSDRNKRGGDRKDNRRDVRDNRDNREMRDFRDIRDNRDKFKRRTPPPANKKRSRDSRSPSPPREHEKKRDEREEKRKEEEYFIKLSAAPIDTYERQYSELKRRYPNLHVSSDFTKMYSHWTKLNVSAKELMLDHPVRVECDNEHGSLISTATPSEPASLYKGVKHNAKVMISLGTENIYSTKFHLSTELRFVVGKKDRSGLMCLGGSWCEKDGSDPMNDDKTLIRTAIRCTKEFIGIDLSACDEWMKVIEIWYHRPAETYQGRDYIEMEERTVVFIPNTWKVVPSQEAFKQVWEERISLIQQAEEKKKEEKKEETSSKETLPQMPSDPVVYAVTQKTKLAANMKTMTISLDGLLDYNLDDRLEKTFEVSLFAEAMNETLQRKFGNIIVNALKVGKQLRTKEKQDAAPSAKKQKTTDTRVDNETEQKSGASKEPESKETSSSSSSGEGNTQVVHDDILSEQSIVAAFSYFDRNAVGFIRPGDLESIIHTLGVGLSKGFIHELVSSSVPEGQAKIYYAELARKVSGPAPTYQTTAATPPTASTSTDASSSSSISAVVQSADPANPSLSNETPASSIPGEAQEQPIQEHTLVSVESPSDNGMGSPVSDHDDETEAEIAQ